MTKLLQMVLGTYELILIPPRSGFTPQGINVEGRMNHELKDSQFPLAKGQFSQPPKVKPQKR
jgi:hypothetical protein